MKIRIKFESLFFCGVFVFWTFFYSNHILFTEQLSLFLYSSDYWGQYALRPGGWADYCGNFLAQFYINRGVGALIQTVFVVVLLALAGSILKKTGEKSSTGWVEICPVLLLLALQFHSNFTPGDSLKLISPFALALLYMNIPQLWMRRVIYGLAIVPVYLFSGAAATCCLYAACTLYELLYAKDAWKYSTPVWIIAAIFLPYGWKSVYLMPNDGLFDILTFPLVEGVKYTPHLLLAFIPFCILALGIFHKKRWTLRISGHIFFILLWTGCGYYLFLKTVNLLEEQKFGMNIAVYKNNWEQVLKISERVKKPDHHTTYYTNLALSMKGELPQKMFRYPQTDESGLFLLRTWEDDNLRYGADFYYHIGILNEAIRWIFDAYILRHNGMDYHTLTRLAEWNKENGYGQVAEKYFDVLEGTLMYRSWAKRQRNAPVKQREKSVFTQVEYYIGGREVISDLARHYEYFPKNMMLLDQLLCYLLLKNDTEKFLNLFNMCYPTTSTLPQAYQEALLLIAGMGKINIQNYRIDNINQLNFKRFNALANSKQNQDELKKQFGDTWWYYFYR